MENIKLTPYQLIFYYEWLADPMRSDYNMVIDNTVTGKMDLQRLIDSIKKIFNEHFIFRHNTCTIDNTVYWVRREPVTDADIIYYYDSALTSEEIRNIVLTHFDLEKDPLGRIHIIRLADEQYRLLFVFHHIAVDGISTEETWDKFRLYYNGINYTLPSIEMQSKTHQELTNSFETLLSSKKTQIESFWKQHLNNVKNIDLTFLKSAYSVPEQYCLAITEYIFHYDEEIAKQVKSLRRHYKITTYLFGQLVMALLLHKMAKQENIPLVYPVAILEGKELLYGAHVNTLPINYHFDDNTTLQSTIDAMLDYHKEVKKTSAKYLPIYDIISYADNSAILDVAFVQTFLRDHTSSLNGITDEKINHEFQIDLANKLIFEQEEHHDRINYRVKFNQHILDKELVKQFVQLYQQLFSTLLNYLLNNQADVLIKNINIIDDATYQLLIHDKNQTRKPYKDEQSVNQQFEEQVLKTPNHIAVIFNQQQLTYAVLNAKANQLAHFLQQQCHLTADDFVGLYLDRSEQIIICILAILKAGAAYVPLDPEAPDERNAYIIQDAKLKAILTQSHYTEKLTALVPHLAIYAIDDSEIIQTLRDYPTDNLKSHAHPNDLAYVIYTSGTTGKPKGTLIEHHNISRLINNTNFVSIDESDRLLSISGYHFDASTYDIFGALLNGATVVIVTKEKFLDLETFNQLLNDYKITNFFATAAFFNTIVDAELPNLAQLHYLLAGGEALSAHHVNKFLARYPHVKLVNGYGPTETTTFAVTYLANQASQPFSHSVPIGVALTNTTLYILDEQQRPVPIGAIGELYIGGAGVGRGYLNNQELTQKVFISNPFQTAQEKQTGYNGRLYKTGDLVRYLPDGNIEYLGRNDLQVKIRGFRVELSEIETRLMSYPTIKQAAVLALTNASGHKYLAAYYVADQVLVSEALTSYLIQFLPEYMLPTAFIYLAAFPLNLNGKIDRKALPTPELTISHSFVAPETVTEQFLVEIYSDLLGLNTHSISIEDDFFKLGGNSIIAIKLSSRIAKKFNKKIHIADIFSRHTIRALGKFIDESKDKGVVITPINVSKPEDQLLSFAQERLWFIESYEGGTSAYNIPLIFKVVENKSLRAIELAMRHIIHRHEVLRSLIKNNKDGVGYQYPIDIDKIPLEFELLVCDSITSLNNYIDEHTHKIFKLDKEIPLSIKFYQLANDYYVSIVIHHIAFDGWSTDLLIKELTHYYHQYEQRSLNSASTFVNITELPAVEVQYKQFALWQRQYLQGALLAQQLSYWQQQLADYVPLHLPTDYDRPLQIDYQGRDIHFQLDTGLSQQLRQLAVELDVSLYSVLLSGYYLLLNAFSNQKDIIVGTPTAGRHYQGIENTMGFFVNSLPLRQHINNKATLVDFIKQTGELISSAQKQQDIPFEKLVETINLEKDASRHPIFQVMFSVQPFGHIESTELAHLLTLYHTPQADYQPAKFDITTLLDDSRESISGVFNYATSLFKAATIEQFIVCYKTILAQFAVTCEKQQSLAKISLLDHSTYQLLIHDKNQTRKPYKDEQSVNQQFEEQVLKTPNHIAVIFNQQQLTYAVLNAKANQLAHFLQQQCHLTADDFVGLYLDRSEQIIICILAILKAGAAYVPLDPEAPDERNAYIIQDAKLKAILTQSHYTEKLTALVPHLAIYAIDDSEIIQTLRDYPTDNLKSHAHPNDLAYVIYTSGTTGKPKGTLIEHHNISRLINNTNFVSIDESDRLLSISGYHFDASTYDIFGALLNGATVVIVTKEKFLDLETFNQLLNDYKITNFFATAAFFNTIVDAELPNLAQLHYLLAGGEALSAHHVNKFLARYPHVKLVNGYGPTETTTFAVTYLANQASQPFSHSVPIGVALTNTTLYILDEQQRPVPIGAIGELYIGGAGVGRGYLNNQELTQKVFISNPFQTAQEKQTGYNGRLYKTGDLVRYLPDGNIEYLGRNDLQVKIRGFRVELSEIETRLMSYPTIKQAAVLALTNASGHKYLAAYYVADQVLVSEALTSYLIQFLPEYMLPTAFIYLAAFPLNLNGKIDRKALPTPELTISHSFVAPTNKVEQVFCQIVADVLRIEEKNISIEDDFFKLGGDSISSIQLASRIRQALGYYLSIKDIFNYRTIKALSDYVIKNNNKMSVNIQSEQGLLEGDIALSPIQQWFFNSMTLGKSPDAGHWNQAFLIKVPVLNHQILKLSAQKLVAYHDMFRTIYPNLDKGNYQKLQPLAFDCATINGLSCEQISQVLTKWQSQFDIKHGCLYHIGYLEGYPDNSARIHIAVHHLNIDAVSWRIIKHDLQSLYEFFRQHQPFDETLNPEQILGAKGTSYRQWVNAQQNYLSNKSNMDELEYWHNLLADFEIYQQYINQFSTDTLSKLQIQLSEHQTRCLLKETNSIYHTTINDILLAALIQTLSIVFDTPTHYLLLEGHGREKLFDDIDVNNTVGWFTCMYPVKLLANESSIIATLVNTKELLRSIPQKGLGYGILQGYVKQQLPTICFNYLGQFDTDQDSTLWTFSHEGSGVSISPNNRITEFLSLNGGVLNNQLQFNVEAYLSQNKLKQFSMVFNQQLTELITLLVATKRSYLTVSDINGIISAKLLDKLQVNKEIEAIYPANSLQQGFIYHDVAQGASDSAYRVQMIWDYYNSIQIDILKQAWQISQRNYPALRLRFSWDEEFIQLIDKQSSFGWTFIDLCLLTEHQQSAKIKQLIEKDLQISYDLTQGMLFRIYLVKLTEDHFQCLFNCHHAIIDGWSVPVLLNNVHQNYLNLINNKPFLEQIDDCYFKAQQILQEKAHEAEAFWQSYLTNSTDSDNLENLLKEEMRHLKLSEHKFVIDQQELAITFTKQQSKQLKQLCHNNDITLNALMQYCWHQQLSLYGNTKITTVGMTVSGRNLPLDGIEMSVGLYINTLPVILEHTEGRVIDTIKQLQLHINNVNNYCNINLIKLQQAGTRMFNSLFVFENYPISEITNGQLKVTFQESKEKLDYPLAVIAFEKLEQIQFKIKYAGELFSKQTIERVLQGIQLTLQQLIINPAILTQQLSLLTHDEYQQLVIAQPISMAPFAKDKLVSQIFEQQVQKTPNNIAVVYENIQLTYQELNDYTNQLANYLIASLTIKPDDLIALYLDKSEQMIISILAILKAGAGYVPMSPKAPDERIQLMVDDTKAKAVLTNTYYENHLNQCLGNSTAIISIDDNAFIDMIRGYDTHNINTQTKSHNLAYIIYTSGTTGKPKGAMIEHYSLVNFATTNQAALHLKSEQGYKNVLWFSNYVFDAHVLEVYNALLSGHCLHLLSEDKRLDFNALVAYIKDKQIYFAFITPALLDKNDLLPIPVLSIGGEAANNTLVQRYCEQQTILINGYGPTETTVLTTTHTYQKNDISNNLGKALNNVCLYILDEYLRPVPKGVIGELYIGGDGVGRGYLNNIELTNKAFIINPFQSVEAKKQGNNERLYKTGDLVRYLANGDLEYIGRNDFQVKIRGFRIELGEIESRLISYQGIKQALVTALTNSLGNKYLVAYYVAECSIAQDKIQQYLQQFLPDYMLPSAYVHLNALPININGKIDRKALPIPTLTTESLYIAPATSTEQKLVESFAELLGIAPESISSDSDFFWLGGNSILAIRLSNRITECFNKLVHIIDIFNKRSVQAIAQLIDELDEKQQVITAPLVDRPEDQLLSFAQERLWFIDSYEGGSNAYNIPLILKLTKDVDIKAVNQTLCTIVSRHEILRTLIKTNDYGKGYQIVMDLREDDFTISPQSCKTQAMLDEKISEHMHKIFLFDQEWPISIQCYLFNNEYYLSIVIHHIAFDGWSSDIFIKEFISCYHQIKQHLPIELPAINTQYKDFALWQRAYLSQKGILEQQLKYWQQQLADYEPLNLPTDYPRPAQIDYTGSNVSFKLNSKLSQELRTIADELKVSLYTVLLSGYYLLLSAFSGQRDIVIGTPIAGRHYQGIENTIGLFVNTIILRSNINTEDTLTNFIQQTSNYMLQAQRYQDLPFEKLVEAIELEKDPARHPIFQVMFGVQSFAGGSLAGAEGLFVPYQIQSDQYQPAKFDIMTMLDDSKAEISGVFNYATGLFTEQTIINYIEIYRYILQQFINLYKEQQTIAKLSFLSPSMYQRVIYQWNETIRSYPKDMTIHAMFEKQVQKTPNYLAIIYQQEHLTYETVNERANQLAHYLRTVYFIQPDGLIALCLERSTYMLISIQAILKAGGAYVPMDPQAPNERIVYMLADTKAKVILTTQHSYERIKSLASSDQIVINLEDPDVKTLLASYSTANLPALAKPTNLAYLIYTSGTTGNPKGVMLEHQGVINRINWMHKKYPITAKDRILQKTNYTFDVSVWELFWANWYGACTVYANSELYKDNIYLVDLIESEKITVLHFVPSMLIAFIETLEAQPELQLKVQGLKYIFCSGEALSLYEVKKCQQLIPNCQIHNLYGPTEATVDVLYYDCNDPNISQVLIGKPIDNTTSYVLNEFLQPVPIGGIGELYIGGAGIARGYLNKPDLTKEKFLVNPFQTERERQLHYNYRLYKTGDVVRALPDGNIQYLGRNDFQVKIRGFRIELGEIEHKLVCYPTINHCVVISYEQASGSKYLVAYYVAPKVIDEQLLSNYLYELLPSYMIPIAFIYLSELPITSNGKLNRKALPKPELTDKIAYIAPANATEEKLGEIFGYVLQIPITEISMQDNFFKIGGNSILAMMLNNKINEAFQIKLRLIDILNTQTIRELAIKITNAKQAFNPIVSLNKAIDKPLLFMIHPGIGGCDVYRSLANKLAVIFHCQGIDSYNFYHEEKIDNLHTLTKFYLNHIEKYLTHEQPINLFGWSLGGNIALEMATCLESMGFENINLYLLDTWLLKEQDIVDKTQTIELVHIMKELNISPAQRGKVETLMEIDNRLVVQPLTAVLNKTHVILFKATKNRESIEYLYDKYPLNNIDKYINNTNQLRVIEIESDHYKIIKQEQTILNYMQTLIN